MISTSNAVEELSKALDTAVAERDRLKSLNDTLIAYCNTLGNSNDILRREYADVVDERDALEERVKELADRLWKATHAP